MAHFLLQGAHQTFLHYHLNFRQFLRLAHHPLRLRCSSIDRHLQWFNFSFQSQSTVLLWTGIYKLLYQFENLCFSCKDEYINFVLPRPVSQTCSYYLKAKTYDWLDHKILSHDVVIQKYHQKFWHQHLFYGRLKLNFSQTEKQNDKFFQGFYRYFASWLQRQCKAFKVWVFRQCKTFCCRDKCDTCKVIGTFHNRVFAS